MTSQRILGLTACAFIPFALTACGGDDGSNPVSEPATDVSPAGGDDGDTAGDVGASSGAAVAAISLTLIGGPDEGDHEATVTEAGCSRNPTGDNTFGLQYSRDDAEGLHSLQMVIDDLAGATGGGTSEFVATANVGGNRHHIDRGDGSVVVTDDGDSAVISFEGFTSDGVDISGSVTCNQVVDL